MGVSSAFSWRRVVAGLSGCGLAGSLLALIAADLLPLWWWSEALQHPRLQIALGSLLCAIIWSLLAAWRWRWFSLLLPLWAVAGMLPSLSGGGVGDQRLATLVSANVLSSNPDPARAVARLRDLAPDVLILLEPDHGWRAPLQALRDDYPVRREILRDDNFGICAYARSGTITVWQPEGVEVPGLVIATAGVEILAVHPPPPFSAAYHAMWSGQLAAIARWSATRPRAIVAGDLNATPWSSGFRRLCANGVLHGPGGLAAWTPTWLRGTLLAATIDHVLAGSDVVVHGHTVGPAIGSDHQPVQVELRLIRP